jgi:AraC-like DNA-binding protein
MTWIFLSSAFGAFLIALGQVFYLTNSKNRVAFLMYLCMAYILLYYQLAFDLTMVPFGHMFLTGNIAGIAAGCLSYFHVRSVTNNAFVFGWRHGTLILACIAIYALPLLPFWQLTAAAKADLLNKTMTSGYLYWNEPRLFGISVFKISNTIFALNSIVFVGLATLNLIRSIEREGIWRNFYFYLSIIMGIGLASTLIGCIGVYSGSLFLIQLVGFILGASIFGFYLVGQAFPWVLYERNREANHTADEATAKLNLRDEDVKKIADKLDILLRKDNLYKKSDLTLMALAAAVGVHPHQLSAYLNRFEKKRFTAFINSFRIAEAQRLFAADPKANNIIVARETGFNSDTHFYFVFQNLVGVSPGKYRRELKEKSQN